MKITEGQTHHITCPGFECSMLVPVEIIEKLVSREMARRYLQFDIKVNLAIFQQIHCVPTNFPIFSLTDALGNLQ